MNAVETREFPPQPVVSIRQTIPTADLIATEGQSLQELWRLLRDRGITPAGPPFVRYHTFDAGETDVEIGVPVTDNVVGEGRVVGTELPGGPAVTTVHLGAHDRLGEAYRRIAEAVATRGQANGPGWEIYEWIDLTQEPNPASWPAPSDWRTELVQPIK
ncbi:GyrI-like domain-containing protein [Actinoplanes sp. NPDC051513]|uniref:GyrI-like domain-containing protein n=1 Tax=Actinoplanes sp. NPDC051513 TaxID=3363908 RepID=UPI0037B5E685